MENEKSFLYTLTLGVCIIISLLLIGRMLLYRPAPIHMPHMTQAEETKPSEKSTAYLSNNDIMDILQLSLPDEFPLEISSLTISKEGRVHVSAELQKEKIQHTEGLETLQAILKWMPDRFAIETAFTATSTDGELLLIPLEMKAAGFSLPVDQLPDGWTDMANRALNQLLKERYPDMTSIRLLDGGLQLHRPE